jgi:dTDP-4-amino-4,6-dideoxygalactose transaminase
MHSSVHGFRFVLLNDYFTNEARMIPNAHIHRNGYESERTLGVNERIHVTRPFLPPLEEFMPYLETIWREGWVTNNGRYHQELEDALCSYLGVKYISLFSSGTAALIVAIKELGLCDEVITTPYSFVATVHSLVWNGVKPIFVDIDPVTMNISPEAIERAITSKTTGILPVHVYGNPCNVEEIGSIARKYSLKIVYDSCHAFGVKVRGASILNFGDLSVLSFHATKVFNTFEGGAIVSHDQSTKQRIDLLKNFGFSNETTVIMTGINAKMNEFQSALGVLQIKYIDDAIQMRSIVVDNYRKLLAGIDGLSFMSDIDGVSHNYSYFPIMIDVERFGRSRDDVYEELKMNNIHARRYFFPLISHFHPYRDNPTSSPVNLRNAESLAQRVLCLPVYPELAWPDQMRIISTIKGML